MRFFKANLFVLLFVLTAVIACSPPEREPESKDVIEQEPRASEVSPEIYRILAENDYLRLIHASWEPGERDEFHSHPPFAIYFLTDMEGKIYYPDGLTKSINAKAGDAAVLMAEPSHSVENLSDHRAEMVIVERKFEMPVFPLEDADPLSTDVSPDVYRLLAEGENLRVIVATWEPGQRDIFHSHPAFAVYLLTDIDGLLHQPGGFISNVRMEKGKGVVQYPDPSHSFENNSDKVAKMLIVEAK